MGLTLAALAFLLFAAGCGSSTSGTTGAGGTTESDQMPRTSQITRDGWIVWTDSRNDTDSDDGLEQTDIYGLDLSTGEEVAVACDPGSQSQPAVCDNWVVWVDVPQPRKIRERTRRLPHARIVATNLRTGRRRTICAAKGWRRSPVISGSTIVWADSRNAPDPLARDAATDLYAYDLTSGSERPLCTAPGTQDEPAISGRWVLWRDTRNLPATAKPYPEGDIYAFNLNDGSERRLTPRTGPCWSPAVCEGRALWKSQEIEIRVLELASGSAAQLGDVMTGFFEPQISAGWVVVQTEGDPGMIVAIELEGQHVQQVVPLGSSQRPYSMALSDDLLVWSDLRSIEACDLQTGMRSTVCAACPGPASPAVSVQ